MILLGLSSQRGKASRVRRSLLFRLFVLFFAQLLSPTATHAWEWSDFVSSSGGGGGKSTETVTSTTTLSIQEVSDLRVRDIKRRLTRNHGYAAEELGRILDKKELIHALAFEEEKLRLQHEASAKRLLIQQGIIAAIVTILLILCWPLFQQAYEVAAINLIVYTDRKRYEAARCYELQSIKAMIGVISMGIFDILQIWLTASVLLSWITTSKYFFPVPRLSVRPAQLLGGDMAKSPMAGFGINIGGMLVTWVMRFSYSKIEQWTGNALSAAHRQQMKQAREWETVDDKAARKEARRIAKLEKLQRQQQQQQQHASAMRRQAAPQPPPDWDQPITTNGGAAPTVINSRTHQEFLQQLDEHAPEFDEQVSEVDAHATTLDELD